MGWFEVAARMRCVELVANWVIGDVGAVYDGRDSKGLAKWMEAVTGGIAILEREREREREMCGSSKGLVSVSKISK